MSDIVTVYKKHKFPFLFYCILLVIGVLISIFSTYIVIKFDDRGPVYGLITIYWAFIFYVLYPILKYVTGQKEEYIENIKIFDKVLYFEYSKGCGKITSSKKIEIAQISSMNLSFKTKAISKNVMESKTKLDTILLNGKKISIITKSLGFPDYNMFLSIVKHFIKYYYFSYQVHGELYYIEKIEKIIRNFDN